MTKALEKCREKIVEEFNSQFPADTMIYDSDGEAAQDSLGKDIRINSNWILDSEYMCAYYRRYGRCNGRETVQNIRIVCSKNTKRI